MFPSNAQRAIVNDARESLHRSLESGHLLQRFRDILLASSPIVATKFSGFDSSEQLVVLRQGINMAFLYAEGDPVGQHALSRMLPMHAPNGRDIHPDLHRLWVRSLLEAVSDLDPQFNPVIERAWLDALAPALAYLSAGYHRAARTC